MDELKSLKERLTSIVSEQLNCNPKGVDTKELGEAVDMVKGLAEAIYYCSVTDAMEKSSDEEQAMYLRKYAPEMAYDRYYTPTIYMGRDMDRGMGRMYYTEPWYDPISTMGKGMGNSNSMNNSNYRDSREGKSYNTRRTYMTMKENGNTVQEKNTELEKYIKELGEDIADMLNGSTPEEKNVVKQKLATLVNKM